MRRNTLIALVGGVGLAGLVVAMATGRTGLGEPTAELRTWKGVACSVYLRAEFNPRGKDHFTTSKGSGGLELVDNYPMVVEGTVLDMDSVALLIRAPQGSIWIPRDQIRVIHAVAPTRE